MTSQELSLMQETIHFYILDYNHTFREAKTIFEMKKFASYFPRAFLLDV
jgi:hypothetical protein